MESWMKDKFDELGEDLKSEIREQHIATVKDLKMFVERKLRVTQTEAKDIENEDEEISDVEEKTSSTSEDDKVLQISDTEEKKEDDREESYPPSFVFGRGKGKRHLQLHPDCSEPASTGSSMPDQESWLIQYMLSQFSPASSIPGMGSVPSGSGLQKRKSSQGEMQPSGLVPSCSKLPKRKRSEDEQQPTGLLKVQPSDQVEQQPSVSDVATAASTVLKRKSSEGEQTPSASALAKSK
ncbi:uncharacterized protein LOC127723777, partial [Mytilus californianus]